MKKLINALCCCGLMWAGCKEKVPPISFGTTASADSTGVLTASQIPATQAHNVLVEEFTGQGCNNCPGGHALLESLSAAHSGRINVIGLYFYSAVLVQTEPPTGSVNDLRDSVATNIESGIYGTVGGIPASGVDRTPPVGGNLLLTGWGTWSNPINTQLDKTDSVNLTVSSTYNAVSRIATIKAIVVFTKPVTLKQNLTVVVVEDSIIDLQDFPDLTVHSGYIFTNVFRAMVTSAPYGDHLGDSTEAGRVYQRVFSYKIPTNVINPLQCRVIAFVNDYNPLAGDLRIQQSAQAPLAP